MDATSMDKIEPFAVKDDGLYELYHCDCIELMQQFLFSDRLNRLSKGQCWGMFDMIFADPPYGLSNGGTTCSAGKRVSVDKGEWDKMTPSWILFNKTWIRMCRDLLKPNGTMWVCGTHHNIHLLGWTMQELGMKILNTITWEKPNPPPNLACRYFTHSTETLLWAAKTKDSKHCFNYHAMKDMNDGKQMKAVWKISPALKWEKFWGKHPTQKPVALLKRIVVSSTMPHDWIFDPFAGSGSTGVAAYQCGRNFVGCEKEETYIDLAKKRMWSEHAE